MADQVFEVSVEHINLLGHMYVGWQDCEFGAPEIDPKRPFGNSNVVGDLYEILVGPIPDHWDEIPVEEEDRLVGVYREMQTVMQILLHNAATGIEPGKYKKSGYSGSWEPAL